MEKTITITVPDDYAADLTEMAQEKGCTEEEIVLNFLRGRITGRDDDSLEKLNAAIAEESSHTLRSQAKFPSRLSSPRVKCTQTQFDVKAGKCRRK